MTNNLGTYTFIYREGKIVLDGYKEFPALLIIEAAEGYKRMAKERGRKYIDTYGDEVILDD